MIVNNIITKKNYYSNFIDLNFERHIENVSKSNGHSSTWATEAEIIAASETYNFEIFIKNYCRQLRGMAQIFEKRKV